MQSDLTGPLSNSGFDGYLSGYPILEIKMFAFARTWYAYEQSRPGCAWTHTLLIANDDLAQFPATFVAEHLFRRPEGNDYTRYAQPIAIDGSGLGGTACDVLGPNVEHLLLSLYADSKLPVVVPADRAADYEQLVIALWMQQWSTLKATFSFSGGSFANRKIGGRTFDLQIVPFKVIRHVLRELPKALVVDPVGLGLPFEVDDWVFAAKDDLRSPNGFRDRLNAIGPRLSSERYFFPIVASLARSDVPLTERSLVKEIKHLYPQSQVGLSVKRDVLNACFSGELSKTAHLSQSELLSEVCSVDSGDAFAEALPDAKRAISELAATDHEVILSLLNKLLGSPVSDHGIALVRHALERFGSEELQSLINGLRPVLPMVVSANPRLCIFPDTWRGDRRQQFQVFEALCQNLDVARNDGRSITLAILRADAHSLASSLTATLGTSVLETVLDAYNRGMTGPQGSVPDEWINELRAHPQFVAEWISKQRGLSGTLLAAVTQIVSPLSQYLDCVPTDVWLSAFTHDDHTCLHERSLCYVLTIGVRAVHADVFRLFPPTLEAVHDAVMERDVAYEEWLWLSNFLPELGWLSNWDRAERLRRGVIDKWQQHEWPVDALLRCFNSERNWHLFVQSCMITSQGTWLLRRVANYLHSNQAIVPRSVQQLISAAIQ